MQDDHITLCEIPEGAVVLAVSEVAEYLDAGGKRQFTVRYTDTYPVSLITGLLVMAEHEIIKRARDGQ